MSAIEGGVLYVVATPIGNLGDMTFRAVEVLKAVSVIAAEDTRHTRHLLEHFGIRNDCLSLHDHNESQRLQGIVSRLQAGQAVALVSDAGTPLISDPGFGLVRAVRQAGFKVVPVPGACAAIAALCVSGLATDRFTFEGFLPAKGGARDSRLKQLARDTRTLVFYESPRRLLESVESMMAVFGANRVAVLAREITKTFETVVQCELSELAEFIRADHHQQKGECVLLVAGAAPGEDDDVVEVRWEDMLTALLPVLPMKEAVRQVAALTGLPRNRVYERALSLKNEAADHGV